MGHPETTAQPEEAFEHRLIEEELSLQLSLLKEQMPADALFNTESDAGDAVKETLGQKEDSVVVIPPPSNELLATEGQMMMNLDEETMETAMICLVIAGLTVGILNI